MPHLHAHNHFSFGLGASSPEVLVGRAVRGHLRYPLAAAGPCHPERAQRAKGPERAARQVIRGSVPP
jgi:hypothetical protein